MDEGYSEDEMSYVKQGEDALQKSLSILGDQDGWTTEIVAVSTKAGFPNIIPFKSISACHELVVSVYSFEFKRRYMNTYSYFLTPLHRQMETKS